MGGAKQRKVRVGVMFDLDLGLLFTPWQGKRLVWLFCRLPQFLMHHWMHGTSHLLNKKIQSLIS
jgi:hypothetical protein